MAEWFRRTSKNIKTFYKRDTQEGSWMKCPGCGEMSYRKVLEKSQDATSYYAPMSALQIGLIYEKKNDFQQVLLHTPSFSYHWHSNRYVSTFE